MALWYLAVAILYKNLVHLKILSRSVENMASHLLTKSVTESTSCQSSFAVESVVHTVFPRISARTHGRLLEGGRLLRFPLKEL